MTVAMEEQSRQAMPRVSVILTSFNHDTYVEEAIGSVLDQTFTDFELIIWDDASTDNSWPLINQFADPRIKAFRNDERRRAIWGLNRAIAEVASGEFIAIHHSDDCWEPHKLERQVRYLEGHSRIGAIFTNAMAVSAAGSRLFDERHFYFNIFDQPNRTRHEWLQFFFVHGNALCHPSVLIRKSCYEHCGLYRFGLAQLGDFDMWIRLCMRYDIHVLAEKLVRFRVHDEQTSCSSPETRVRALYEFYKLLQSYRGLTSFDLVKVFPSAAKFHRNDETDVKFALAMVALEEGLFAVTRLFGLDLLFEIISDPQRAAAIKRSYDFDYKGFIALTAIHDVFSSRDVASLSQEVARLVEERDKVIEERDKVLQELDKVLEERDRLLSSRSWRVTRPLRALRRRSGELLRPKD